MIILLAILMKMNRIYLNNCLNGAFEIIKLYLIKEEVKEGEHLVDSKQAIMEASMKLMEKKDFNSITIREIAEKAGVNIIILEIRRSFLIYLWKNIGEK